MYYTPTIKESFKLRFPSKEHLPLEKNFRGSYIVMRAMDEITRIPRNSIKEWIWKNLVKTTMWWHECDCSVMPIPYCYIEPKKEVEQEIEEVLKEYGSSKEDYIQRTLTFFNYFYCSDEFLDTIKVKGETK